ncbi:hypothetical protein QWZ13_16640 [Reinekea marina]|uniref:hypothetical protein n=1 Tax=Reinekea marina TaxID=1310421 RepID=UPI0025B48189|nr:hypothetical protein [Reinekea marina]MDN3650536.1 hypothetical protein [Reinekea marina]
MGDVYHGSYVRVCSTKNKWLICRKSRFSLVKPCHRLLETSVHFQYFLVINIYFLDQKILELKVLH